MKLRMGGKGGRFGKNEMKDMTVVWRSLEFRRTRGLRLIYFCLEI